jgi:hypothetical protein
MIESGDGYPRTFEVYARSFGPNRVYLRPVEGGYTVLSLESDRCSKMIGVGRDPCRPAEANSEKNPRSMDHPTRLGVGSCS